MNMREAVLVFIVDYMCKVARGRGGLFSAAVDATKSAACLPALLLACLHVGLHIYCVQVLCTVHASYIYIARD